MWCAHLSRPGPPWFVGAGLPGVWNWRPTLWAGFLTHLRPGREARAPQAARLHRSVRRRGGVSRCRAHGVRFTTEQRHRHQPLPPHAGLARWVRGTQRHLAGCTRLFPDPPPRPPPHSWASDVASPCRHGCPAFRPRQPVVFFSEEKDTETGPESNVAKESVPAPAADAGGSELSDEEVATLSAESRDAAEEDTPGPAGRAQEQESIFDAATPATPREPASQEDSVDLLGLHSGTGPAPPVQACGAVPSNADLLSRLLGAPDTVPEVPPGDLLGGDAPLLFTSPAPPLSAQSPPREGPAVAGTWIHPVGSRGYQGFSCLALPSKLPGRSSVPCPSATHLGVGGWAGQPRARCPEAAALRVRFPRPP